MNRKKYSLGEDTASGYNGVIQRFATDGIDITKLNFDDFVKFINGRTISKTSIPAYISAVLYGIRNVPDSPERTEYVKKLNDLMGTCVMQKTIDKQDKVPTEREVINFTTWKSVLDIYKILSEYINSLEKIEESHKQLFWYYAILSLYILIPPRRRDYATLTLNNTISIDEERVMNSELLESDEYVKGRKWENKYKYNKIDTKNYYREDGYLVLSNYKTARKYGTQYIKVSKTITDVINRYIKLFNIQEGGRLFTQKVKNTDAGSELSKSLAKFFRDVSGKKIGVSALRHMYCKYLRSGNFTAERKYLTAQLMGHSVSEQDTYNKLHVFEEVLYETLKTNFQTKITDKYTNLIFDNQDNDDESDLSEDTEPEEKPKAKMVKVKLGRPSLNRSDSKKRLASLETKRKSRNKKKLEKESKMSAKH